MPVTFEEAADVVVRGFEALGVAVLVAGSIASAVTYARDVGADRSDARLQAAPRQRRPHDPARARDPDRRRHRAHRRDRPHVRERHHARHHRPRPDVPELLARDRARGRGALAASGTRSGRVDAAPTPCSDPPSAGSRRFVEPGGDQTVESDRPVASIRRNASSSVRTLASSSSTCGVTAVVASGSASFGLRDEDAGQDAGECADDPDAGEHHDDAGHPPERR